MKTIAFYISDHGYGHMARNIPIIRAMAEGDAWSADDESASGAAPGAERSAVRGIVKSGAKQLEFLRSQFEALPSALTCYAEEMDPGLILQEGSFDVDRALLEKKVLENTAAWPARAAREAEFLRSNKVDLVVSDIVPWIFPACHAAGIRSILLTHFTWVDQYRELLHAVAWKPYLDAYRQAGETWVYPLDIGILEYAVRPRFVGMSSRPFDERRVREIRSWYRAPIVFVSVGRSVQLAGAVDVGSLPYTFLYTDGIRLEGDNAIRLPVETPDTHNYIKAADIVITKCGWSTVSESLCAARPMILMDRPGVPEDRLITEKLVKEGRALTIRDEEWNPEDLSRLLYEVGKIDLGAQKKYTNESDIIAKDLLNALYQED